MKNFRFTIAHFLAVLFVAAMLTELTPSDNPVFRETAVTVRLSAALLLNVDSTDIRNFRRERLCIALIANEGNPIFSGGNPWQEEAVPPQLQPDCRPQPDFTQHSPGTFHFPDEPTRANACGRSPPFSISAS